MGRLIIDGNSFFEIDEECLKRKKVSRRCGLDKYLKDENYRNNSKQKIPENTSQRYEGSEMRYKRGDG